MILPSSFYNNPHVKIRNIEAFLLKQQKILHDGAKNLHVIADFDSTLTKHMVDGKRNIISHLAPSLSKKVSVNFKRKCDALDEEYFPLQRSESLSFEEKYSLMTECWNLYNQVYIEEKLSRQALFEALEGISLHFREGTECFFELIEKKSIPTLILSAGVTDVIEVLLEQNGLMKPCIYVLSNAMIYSSEEPNHCINFTSPPIHILNKGEASIFDTPHYELIKSRPNIILLGDSLGDLEMSKAIPHETILTIGFLNHDIEKYLDIYIDSYDMVIIGDNDFGPVNEIFEIL